MSIQKEAKVLCFDCVFIVGPTFFMGSSPILPEFLEDAELEFVDFSGRDVLMARCSYIPPSFSSKVLIEFLINHGHPFSFAAIERVSNAQFMICIGYVDETKIQQYAEELLLFFSIEHNMNSQFYKSRAGSQQMKDYLIGKKIMNDKKKEIHQDVENEMLDRLFGRVKESHNDEIVEDEQIEIQNNEIPDIDDENDEQNQEKDLKIYKYQPDKDYELLYYPFSVNPFNDPVFISEESKENDEEHPIELPKSPNYVFNEEEEDPEYNCVEQFANYDPPSVSYAPTDEVDFLSIKLSATGDDKPSIGYKFDQTDIEAELGIFEIIVKPKESTRYNKYKTRRENQFLFIPEVDSHIITQIASHKGMFED